jgi:hypothetical protein
LRGTYAGLAHPAVLEHLHGLGVAGVELMPVHHFVRDQRLIEKGLTNYWDRGHGSKAARQLDPGNAEEYKAASIGNAGESTGRCRNV